jgi:hypothetical protein
MNKFDDPYKDWAAAYVLGALSPAERNEYESHLANCANCTSAVAAFAGIPGILSKVDTQTAMTLLDGSPQDPTFSSWNESAFMQKLAKRAEQERQTTRIRQIIGLVAAAVISITIGVTTAGAIHHSSNANLTASSDVLGRAIHVTNLQPQIMTATFRVTSKPWGTRFDWNCTYPNGVSSRYSSSNYDLVVTDKSGQNTVIATWSASGTKAVGLAATSALPESQIKSVEVTFAGSSDPLVLGKI